MGEIADAMLTGVLCAMCGVSLECDGCADMDIPMYCSTDCAESAGASKAQVCDHENNGEE